MAKFNFEGRLENISDDQLEFINKVILEQDIKVKKVTFETVGKPGDNFAANVKRIVIEGEEGNLRLIAKIASQNEIARQLTKTTASFMNEHIMYNEFLPKLEQMQIEAGVPKNDRIRYAKCFGSSNEYLHEVILLEDLDLSEFTIMDKFVSLTDDCIRSVLKNFAILHSLSYVLKYKEPETFEDFKSKLLDFWTVIAKEDQSDVYMKQFQENLLSVFDENKAFKNKVHSKLVNMLSDTLTLAEYEHGNKNSVILQGDAWTNNFMFRFKEGQLQESIMIDYQLSKNGNPVNDILFMIFNCTDYETRSKYFFDWIEYYYTELDKSLSYFNLKASSVYPREEMDADMKRCANFVFSQSCFATSVLMRTSDESVGVTEGMQNSSDYTELLDSVKTDNIQDASRKKIIDKITDIYKSFEECNIF